MSQKPQAKTFLEATKPKAKTFALFIGPTDRLQCPPANGTTLKKQRGPECLSQHPPIGIPNSTSRQPVKTKGP